jgi:Protein of unknown function (DUF3800)
MRGILSHSWGLSSAQDRVWAQVSGLAPSVADKRLLMVLQAFIDDSATTGGVFVLAGHIASAEVWAQFAKEWDHMLPYSTLDKYGKYHFKMSEMTTNPERMSRVEAFYRLIENHDLISISCMVDVRSMKKAIGRIWSLNRRLNWGPYSDQFVFTFRALIDNVHVYRDNHPMLPDGKIDFIFDNQSQKNLILDAWDNFIESRSPDIRSRFGATPRFEDDKEFLPLQAADLWAWWVREWHEDGNPLVTRDDGRVGMRLPRLVSSDRGKRAVIIEYDEDQIVESLIRQAKYQFPDLAVYDAGYRGQSWS